MTNREPLTKSEIQGMPIYMLLKIGRILDPTDYPIKYYYNKKHPKFYKQRSRLIQAVYKAWEKESQKGKCKNCGCWAIENSSCKRCGIKRKGGTSFWRAEKAMDTIGEWRWQKDRL